MLVPGRLSGKFNETFPVENKKEQSSHVKRLASWGKVKNHIPCYGIYLHKIIYIILQEKNDKTKCLEYELECKAQSRAYEP